MEEIYYILDRNRTNGERFLTKSGHWVDDRDRHKALWFRKRSEAQKILDSYLKENKINNKFNMYRVELYMRLNK